MVGRKKHKRRKLLIFAGILFSLMGISSLFVNFNQTCAFHHETKPGALPVENSFKMRNLKSKCESGYTKTISRLRKTASRQNTTQSSRRSDNQICSPHLSWVEDGVEDHYSREAPVVALLGPNGSGLYWLRYLIEQMSGIYTGSPVKRHNQPVNFKGDGIKDSTVLAVSSHYANQLENLKSGIILYRNVKDSVRSEFHMKQYYAMGGNQSFWSFKPKYLGEQWQHFAEGSINEWQESYRSYLEVLDQKPYLVIDYRDLVNKKTLARELKIIASFLGLNSTTMLDSKTDCVVRGSHRFQPPPTGGEGFLGDPFNHLTSKDIFVMTKYEKHIYRKLFLDF